MQCQKTGAQIFLAEYGAYALCDAFYDEQAGAYLFRIVSVNYKEPVRGDKVHYTVHHVQQWFDKNNGEGPTSTLYSNGNNVTRM